MISNINGKPDGECAIYSDDGTPDIKITYQAASLLSTANGDQERLKNLRIIFVTVKNTAYNQIGMKMEIRP